MRRGVIPLKPAKLNILEFQGDDAEHWIQTIERYFDTIQTPLDKRTGFFCILPKGNNSSMVVRDWVSCSYTTLAQIL